MRNRPSHLAGQSPEGNLAPNPAGNEDGNGQRHSKDPADTVLESGGFSRESALSPVGVNTIAL